MADERVSSVEANVTGVGSQLSFSFGTREGWSYLSAGFGTMRVQTEAVRSVATSTRSSGYAPAVNAGAGARWFFTSRLAVGFDLRMYRVSARGAVGTPRVTLLSASAGLSIR
jgi:hypothetical protein